MNHKEFRIGNLVDFEGRIFEIDTIAESMPTLNTGEFGIGVVLWRNLKPIRLSEELLIKFGFEEHVNDYYYIGEYKIRFDDEQDFYFVFFDIGDWEMKIEFVHQLQNLYFALTGRDLPTENISE